MILYGFIRFLTVSYVFLHLLFPYGLLQKIISAWACNVQFCLLKLLLESFCSLLRRVPVIVAGILHVSFYKSFLEYIFHDHTFEIQISCTQPNKKIIVRYLAYSVIHAIAIFVIGLLISVMFTCPLKNEQNFDVRYLYPIYNEMVQKEQAKNKP